MSKENAVPVMTLALAGFDKSSWINEENPNDVLAGPRLLRLPNVSRVKEEMEGGGYLHKDIMYVQGAPTIYKDELIKRRIIKEDGMLTPTQRQNSQIFLSKDSMIYMRQGNDITKFDFLKNCEWNGSNPNRIEESEIKFVELVSEKVAQQKLIQGQTVADAYAYMAQVRPMNAAGEHTVNSELLAEAALVLNLGHLATEDEQLAAMFEILAQNPSAINNLRKGKNEIAATIKKAVELKALSLKENKAQLTDDSKTVIKAFKGNVSEASMMEQLVTFFATEEGKPLYSLMKGAMDKKSANQLSNS